MAHHRRSVGVAFGIAVLAALAAAVVKPDYAHACTCVVTGEPFQLRDDQVAVVGVVTTRHIAEPQGVGSSADPTLVTIRVEAAFNAVLPERIVVRTAASTASCGIAAHEGDRVGLLLRRDSGNWSAGLCGQLDPDDLLAAGGQQRIDGGSSGRGDRRWLVAAAVGALTTAAFLIRRRLRNRTA